MTWRNPIDSWVSVRSQRAIAGAATGRECHPGLFASKGAEVVARSATQRRPPRRVRPQAAKPPSGSLGSLGCEHTRRAQRPPPQGGALRPARGLRDSAARDCDADVRCAPQARRLGRCLCRVCVSPATAPRIRVVERSVTPHARRSTPAAHPQPRQRRGRRPARPQSDVSDLPSVLPEPARWCRSRLDITRRTPEGPRGFTDSGSGHRTCARPPPEQAASASAPRRSLDWDSTRGGWRGTHSRHPRRCSPGGDR
jgi:hypothetical protein